MISVSFHEDRERGSITMRVRGHSNSDKHGKDLVCASASILAYTAAQTLQCMFADGDLRSKPLIRLKEGDAVITVRPKQNRYTEALHVFFVIQMGYFLLSRNYPQYVELFSFGEAD